MKLLETHFVIKFTPKTGGAFFLDKKMKSMQPDKNNAKEYKRVLAAITKAKQVHATMLGGHADGHTQVVQISYVQYNQERNGFYKELEKTVYSV